MKLTSYRSTELFAIFLLGLAALSCRQSVNHNTVKNNTHQITCDDTLCQGTYRGKEFVNGEDVAHQFSNKMSSAVGDKLKEMYDDGKYVKVDFVNISMSTLGMGSGTVVYELKIPFLEVDSKCGAFTSFDHVGGWNHAPELANRRKQLEKVLLRGDTLNVSSLKKTEEGLQEYWIQWRNKDKQKACI